MLAANNQQIPGNPIIYLNNAATSWPKPAEVIDEVTKSLSRPFAEGGRSAVFSGVDYLSVTREELAGFFNTPGPEGWIFTANATDSLNLLIHGFARLQTRRFHMVTTDLEHNSVLRPTHTLEAEEKISSTIVSSGTDGRIDPDDIINAIRPDTRMVVVTHGSNVLGTVQDIKKIGRMLEDCGIFLVIDGSQAAGLVPVDLSTIPIDAYVFTGHKALFGIPGTGGFYLREPEKIGITRQGGTGTDSLNLCHPNSMPERFEIGTPNYPGIASLSAGIRFIQKTGLETIRNHNRKLTGMFVRDLCSHPKITVYCETPDLPVISFNITGIPPDDVGFILSRGHGIITRTGLHCAPLIHQRIDNCTGCVRVSPGFFTTTAECRQAIDTILELADDADS